MPSDSEDRKLLQSINTRLEVLINGLEIQTKQNAEFKAEIKAEVKDLKKRVSELELTGATNEVMMGNLNQIKSSLIKWIMVMFTSSIVAGFAVIKFVL